MSMTGLDVFDTTIHKTNSWLHDLMRELDLQQRHEAYHVLRVTLHALRDRLTVEETAQLAAQLPMLIRGFYYEGWDPTAKPEKVRHLEQFVRRMEQEYRGDRRLDLLQAARAVFRVMSARLTPGEVDDVKHVLPTEIRDLWPVPTVGVESHGGQTEQASI
jgi:uncharacterized protein (DUF2267 family)